MTNEQAEQWRVLAKSLAYGLYPSATPQRQQRLWSEVEQFIDGSWEYGYDGWDDGFNDNFDELFYEFDTWSEGCPDSRPGCFFNQLRCVARISLNMIFQNDDAAIGWTVGDMRRIFGDPLPDWFNSQYEGLTAAPNDACIVL